MTKTFTFNPVPSDLDLDAEFKDFEDKWVELYGHTPNKGDLSTETWFDYAPEEWKVFLKEYFNSDNPSKAHFAEFIFSHKAIK